MKCGKSILSSEMQQRLRELIDSNTSLPKIAQATGLREDAAVAETVILLRSGYNIRKTHLMHLVGVDDGIFSHIKTFAVPGDFHLLDSIDRIKAKFCANTKITEHMLVLVLNYLRVRQYMKMANMPYFDPDEDKLMNAESFLRKIVGKIAFDLVASTSSEAANDLSMDGDEFDDDMIDKIFVDWSPEEPSENVPAAIGQAEPAEPSVETRAIASTSNANAIQTGDELVHDISVEEIIDEEMIDNIFVDWSEEGASAPQKKNTQNENLQETIHSSEALHECNTKQEIPKSFAGNVAQSTNTSPSVLVKNPKVAPQRVYVKQKTHVQYCSDTDSEEENLRVAAKPQRSLPNWMAQRPATAASKIESETNAKRIKKAKF